MSKKLNPLELEFYRTTVEVLHYIWDPIGVSTAPSARDEYRSYHPKVFNMLITDKPDEDVVNYLVGITTERMGLKANKEKAKRVVKILNEYKEKIFQTAL